MEEKMRDSGDFSIIGMALLFVVVLGQLSYVVLNAFFTAVLSVPEGSTVATMVGLYGVAFPVALWYLGRPTLPNRTMGEKRPAVFLQYLIMSFGVLYCANWLTLLITTVIQNLSGAAVYNPVDTILQGNYGLVLLRVCILAPVMEELLFRWAILGRLAHYGNWFATMVSGLLFAVLHGSISQFLYAFAVGILLAQFVLRGGEIWQSILLHSILNGSSLFWSTSVGLVLAPYLVLVLMIAGAVLLKGWMPSFLAQRQPTAELWRMLGHSPELILFFVAMIIKVVASNLW